MNQSDEGYRAFMNKDWKTASSEFIKKVKKPRKRGSNVGQQNCESLVYAAISMIYLNSDKADQIYGYLEKSMRIDKNITKDILQHIVRAFLTILSLLILLEINHWM